MKSTFSFMTGNVLVLTVCRIIFTMSQSLAGPFFSLFVLALGGTVQDIGVITALGGVAGLIFYPLGGYVADMKGRVRLVGLSTFAYAISYFFYAGAWSWQTLALGVFIQQLVLFYMPALNAIMADSLPVRMRGIGYATTNMIPSTIGIVIPYIGGFLIDKVFMGDVMPAMRLSYTISGILGFLVAVIRLKWLKETVDVGDKKGVTLGEIPGLLKQSYLGIIETLKWFSQTLRSVAVVQMIITFSAALAGPYWIVRANKVVGLSVYDFGVLTLLAGAFNLLLSIPMGRLIDRFGPRKIIVATSAISPFACLLFPFCTSFTEMLAVILLLAVFNSATPNAFTALMVGHIPVSKRGRVFSLIGGSPGVQFGGIWMDGVLIFISGTLGSLAGGFIYAFDSRIPWFILSAALVCCTIFTAKYIKDPQKT
jgi:MFS family permease